MNEFVEAEMRDKLDICQSVDYPLSYSFDLSKHIEACWGGGSANYDATVREIAIYERMYFPIDDASSNAPQRIS